jgi:hypothetical protein
LALADGLSSGTPDPVDNEEWLYRRVDPAKVRRDGRPGSQAFGPIENGMSVDRAKLCGHDPAHVKMKPTDYVCSAAAEVVRSIRTEQHSSKGKPLGVFHATDVKATPTKDNPAHADVHEDPTFPHPNMYKRLKASLAKKFEWESGFGP